MGKMETTLDDKLPAFQKYLLEKNLAPAKNVPFYAHWVSRFLDYARRNEFSALEYQEAAVLGFLDSLKSENHVLDWQYRQANDSIRLYYFHYLNKTDARSVKAVASDSMSEIIQETKRLIRLKHYSYSTERTGGSFRPGVSRCFPYPGVLEIRKQYSRRRRGKASSSLTLRLLRKEKDACPKWFRSAP